MELEKKLEKKLEQQSITEETLFHENSRKE
jgi:hypothetical protein